MALITDPSNIASNSFVDSSFADDYFSKRLYIEKWSSASITDKDKAVMWASLLISRAYKWVGTKVNEEQELEFPRYGLRDYDNYYIDQDSYPLVIKEGTCELALHLLQQNPSGDNPLDIGLTELKVSTLSLKFEKDSIMSGSNVDGNQIPENIRSRFSVFIDGSTNTIDGTLEVQRV